MGKESLEEVSTPWTWLWFKSLKSYHTCSHLPRVTKIKGNSGVATSPVGGRSGKMGFWYLELVAFNPNFQVLLPLISA